MNTGINIYIVIAILFIHWVADFVFQTDKQAQGKSKNWGDLLSHTLVYSLVWYLVIFIIALKSYADYFFGNNFNSNPIEDLGWSLSILLFPIITFVCHTITDYFTSRLNAKLWADKKVHNFFVSVGFDQFLHFAQLLLTYQLLIA